MELAPAPWPEHRAEDPIAEVARQMALRTRAALEGRSIRAVAQAAGVSHVTLINVLSGRAWPDLTTIAKLELALEVDLWPGRPD
jgi:transcriptional regulator with XRE-family HTH domain